MISVEKQKAIIEAMLFVSPKPVTLSQFHKKIAKALRLEKKSLEEDYLESDSNETIEEDSDAIEAKDENENVSENDIEVNDDDEQTKSAKKSKKSKKAKSDDESESDEDIKIEAQDEASEDSDENDNDDAMEQLLQKQKELDQDISKSDIKKLLLEIQEDFKNSHHGVELVSVAKGYQIRTKYEMLHYIKDEQAETPMRLSPSSMETLSIIAYQQPATRQKVEEVRGVDCGGVLKTLMEKGFIKIIGRQEEGGKALIYGTTAKFLEVFGLNSLKDLPSLRDLQALELTEGDPTKRAPASQNQDGVSAEDAEDIFASAYSEMDELEKQVLGDLDESLNNLKEVEKQVLEVTNPTQEAEQAESEQSV